MKRLRLILSLYLWGFFIYQIFPVKIIPYLNYAPQELYPVPIIYRYTFAYDIKTAFSSHAGSIKNLLKAMKEKDFDIAFGDFPQSIGGKLFPTPEKTSCFVMKNTDISFLSSSLNFLFETLPKMITVSEYLDVLAFKHIDKPKNCYLIAHDQRMLFTTYLGFEVPGYNYILGNRRNLYFSRELLIRDSYVDEFLRGAVVVFGNPKVKIFAYSERSFYLPGEVTRYPFRYVVEADLRKPLIFIYKDQKVKGIYSQKRVNLSVNAKGRYSAHILTYKFRIHIFYFGVRTVALVSPITLL